MATDAQPARGDPGWISSRGAVAANRSHVSLWRDGVQAWNHTDRSTRRVRVNESNTGNQNLNGTR